MPAEATEGESAVELSIPPQAIVKGNDFRLRVSRVEQVKGQNLAYLENGDRYLFAIVDDDVREGADYGFSLLYDKIGIKAEEKELLTPCSDEVSLEGQFSKQEIREKGGRVMHFYYKICGYTLEALQENGYKINSIDGDNCYKYTYRYVVPQDKVRLVLAEEPGLEAEVVRKLDYGNVCYADARTADGQPFLVKVDKDFEDMKIRVAFDSADVSVYSTRIDMILC